MRIQIKSKIFTLMASFIFTGTAMADFLPNSFSANFTQEYVSSLKGKIKKGNGAIDYRYPGSIRFETTNPSHVLFVTNGVKAWYYTFPFIEGEEGELTETNSGEGRNVFTKFFDSLKNGLVSNSMYEVKKEGSFYGISFKVKTSSDIGIKNAKLFFEGDKKEFSALKAIELEFPDGKKSSMKLAEMKINPKIEEARFNFIPPKKTKKTH